MGAQTDILGDLKIILKIDININIGNVYYRNNKFSNMLNPPLQSPKRITVVLTKHTVPYHWQSFSCGGHGISAL